MMMLSKVLNNPVIFTTIVLFIVILLQSIVISIHRLTFGHNCFFDPYQYKPLYNLQYYYKDIALEVSNISTISNLKRHNQEWSQMDDPETFLGKIGRNDSWIHSWDTSNEEDGKNNWLNYPLIYEDEVVGDAERLCPKTIALLKQIKGIHVAGFSLLKGNSKLYPHRDSTGLSSRSLAFHLGLIGKSDFYMMDKDFTYKMKSHAPGKMLIANTNNIHYVVNEYPDDRVILYIDFDIDKAKNM